VRVADIILGGAGEEIRRRHQGYPGHS
jgi:hypothetical protein